MKKMVHCEIICIDGVAKIRLLEPIKFFIGFNEFEVPVEFISDGMSIPKILWGLICPCLDSRTLKPSIKHDFFYSTGLTTRLQADNIFFVDLVKNAFPVWKACLVWVGLRLFGKSHYHK